GKPLTYERVKVVPFGDPLPGAHARDVDEFVGMSDETGVLAFDMPFWTHVRLVLADGLEPVAGGVFPDTCREATLNVPVEGRARALVTMPAGMSAPATLVAEHVDAKVFP